MFENGLTRFPNDYELLFNSAFLYAFEIGNYSRARELYKKLATINKAPAYIKSLIAKLDFETDRNLDLAFYVVTDLLKSTPTNSSLYLRLQSDLYAIKAEKDLECLNAKNKNCDTIDYSGEAYIYKNGKFESLKEFTPYQLHKKKGKR